ncbi:MAG TPA: TauD/TfdA family dioxygenase [Caulobacteraceae bacterium]|nr:TauD/TfdA family dioxygenase [Caulobacteraceae bacterium]
MTSAGRQIDVEEWPAAGRTLAVRPINPVIGAEIEGVDLSKRLSADQFGELRAALNAHHVLVFRGQTLSGEDHKRFGRLFGPLHVHPYNNSAGSGDDHEILVVKADQNSKFVAGEEWHTDLTFEVEPPMGSILYITETPPDGGGDTLFASTIRAYEALSPAMQVFLEGLTAEHGGTKPFIRGFESSVPAGGWPRTSHPVVIRHPENGRKALFVNRGFTTRINELGFHESDGLLELLWRHVETRVDFQCRVHWEPGTLVFWDNRCTQHHAVWDYFPHVRYGQRVSVVGARPSL